MRYSSQRDTVLKVVKAACDHPTADTIYSRVRAELPKISLGTVYRDLKQLEESGLITVVESSDAKVHYEGHLKEHLHFLCECCGGITDVFCKPVLPEEFSSLRSRGYIIHAQKTVYYGICDKCRNKIDEKNKN